MVKYNQKQLNNIFHALADQTRRDIIERLSKEQYTATELANKYKISFPAVSKHLRVLESAKLVNNSRLGRQHIFSLNSDELNKAKLWVTYWSGYWNLQLDNLEKFLKN
jgi:DNA-binding transcriptional ArsR family regulator